MGLISFADSPRRVYRDWSQRADKVALVNELVRKLGIQSTEDWYSVTANDFKSGGGAGFLNRYGGSPQKAIESLSKEGLIPTPAEGWDDDLFRSQTDWTIKENREKPIARLKERLNIQTAEDWYRVTGRDFLEVGGWGYLKKFDHNVGRAIESLSKEGIIPEPSGGWKKERFRYVTNWDLKENRRALVSSLVNERQIKTPEDWYRVTEGDFAKNRGAGYLRSLGTVKAAILALSRDGLITAPEGGWHQERFKKNTDWSVPENRRLLVSRLIEQLTLRTPEDWYIVSKDDIGEAGGTGYLDRHGGSPKKAIQALSDEGLIPKPNGGWKEEQFGTQIKWNLVENRRNLVKKIQSNLGILKPEDWYRVSNVDFANAGGAGYLAKFEGRTKEAIHSLSNEGLIARPDGDWKEELFVTKTDWDTLDNRRRLVDRLRSSLDLKTPEDWYKVSTDDFIRERGQGYLARFGHSSNVAIQALSLEGLIPQPNGGWKQENFGSRINWALEANRKELVRKLKKSLRVRTAVDWYRACKKDFESNGGSGFLQRFGNSPQAAIISLAKEGLIDTPEGGWDNSRFFEGLKGQKLVGVLAEDLLGEKPLFNDRKSHGVRNPKTNRVLEADIAFPQHKIAIEYQGPAHMDDNATKDRDGEKRKQFPEKGWLLIEVWEDKWDRTEEGLFKLIEDAAAHSPAPSNFVHVLEIMRARRCLNSVESLAL